MADVSESDLKKSIHDILKGADLAKTSVKKVLQALEKTYGAEIRERKAEVDAMVMEYVNNTDSTEEKVSESESEKSEEEVKPKRGAATRANKKLGSGGATKPAKRAGGNKGKGTGFTRSYKLSPALSDLMGAEEMPRHAVVKRIWAIVKENNLYDPSNKQFAICDDALFKVIGKQRFRVFGMMKYLKTHFLLE